MFPLMPTVTATQFLAALPEFNRAFTADSPQLAFWLERAHAQFGEASWGSHYPQAVILQTAVWLHAGAFGHRAVATGGGQETGYSTALRELARSAPRATLALATVDGRAVTSIQQLRGCFPRGYW